MGKTVEAGIGQPDDSLLRGVGRPGRKNTPRDAGDHFPVGYFRPDLETDPKLMVRIEILSERPLRGKVISSFRGSERASDYKSGEVIDIPAGTRLISEGNWSRRKNEELGSLRTMKL